MAAPRTHSSLGLYGGPSISSPLAAAKRLSLTQWGGLQQPCATGPSPLLGAAACLRCSAARCSAPYHSPHKPTASGPALPPGPVAATASHCSPAKLRWGPLASPRCRCLAPHLRRAPPVLGSADSGHATQPSPGGPALLGPRPVQSRPSTARLGALPATTSPRRGPLTSPGRQRRSSCRLGPTRYASLQLPGRTHRVSRSLGSGQCRSPRITCLGSRQAWLSVFVVFWRFL